VALRRSAEHFAERHYSIFKSSKYFFKVVEAVAAALRSASVTEAELKAAKKALAVDISESNINALDLAVDIGVSGIIRSGHPLSSIDKLDLIAQASLADVQVFVVARSLLSNGLHPCLSKVD